MMEIIFWILFNVIIQDNVFYCNKAYYLNDTTIIIDSDTLVFRSNTIEWVHIY